MKLRIIFRYLFFTSTVAFALPKNSAAIKELEQLERSRFKVRVQMDYGFLEKIFSMDLIYIHSNGAVSTKAEYLQSSKEGKSVLR